MSSKNNAVHKTLDSLDEIVRVCGSSVAPVQVFTLFFLGGSNVDAAEFGVHDGCTRLVCRALVNTRDRLQENASTVSLGTNDAFESGAGLFDLWTIAVVVECGQVSKDVLPTAVIVDTSSIVEVPRRLLVSDYLK